MPRTVKKQKVEKVNKPTAEEIKKIIADRTYFSVALSLINGLEIQFDDGGAFTIELDENETPIEETKLVHTKDEYVTINYNEDVEKRIKKYIDVLLTTRGVKDINEIDRNDGDVIKLLNDWKKRQPVKNFKQSELRPQISRFIEGVKRQHRPYFIGTTLQILEWAILYDDLFKVKNKQLECRLEVDIPDSYWSESLLSKDDALDALLDEFTPPDIVLDPTNPLEIMVAIVVQLGEQHKEFSKKMIEYIKIAFGGITLSSRASEIDDAGFLNSTLDELLSENVDEETDSLQQGE